MPLSMAVVCLPPFVALQTEQDRRFVGKILIKRTDTDAGAFSHSGGSETRGALLRQNLNSGGQNGGDQFGGSRLFRLFSRGNLLTAAFSHSGRPMRIVKCE
jgi:hypothetical protein